MPINLNPQCRNRLIELLTKHLAVVKVDHGSFLNFPSTFALLLSDQALPQNGQVRDQLEELIGESPFYEFVFSTLSRELRESRNYESEVKDVPLTNIEGYGNPRQLAERLVADFDALPLEYTFTLELPTSVSTLLNAAATSHVLSDSMSISAYTPEMNDRLPLKSGIALRDEKLFGGKTLFTLLSENVAAEWSKDSALLGITRKGFVGYYGTTRTVDDILNSIKSFVGVGIAIRLFKLGPPVSRQAFGAAKRRKIVVHLSKDGGNVLWHAIELPADLDAVLSRLEVNDIDGDLKGDALVGWVRTRMPIAVTAFRNPERATHVLRASRWLVDSYHGDNALLSFVQATVAMEIMLGDEAKSDIVGIGELLRNRCAYLIGHSHTQRTEILDDFGRIYRVRSKIVHSGKERLTNDEQTLFRKLQWMCKRVASEELELIGKDKK